MTKITHNDLPQAVTEILAKLVTLEEFFNQWSNKQSTENDEWFDLNELVQYDPEKRSKATFYGYIHKRTIPFHKRGKKVTFLKSEIDSWLKEGRRETRSEIEADAGQNLKIRRAKK